jgi:N6-adenosine-specific RNA methylase IME4
MKANIILADSPWSFSDTLEMSKIKRGAKANYDLLDTRAIKNLPVESIAADDSVLGLWVPSSLLQDGLDTMKAWGFRQTQTVVWVKIKKKPLDFLRKEIKKYYFDVNTVDSNLESFNLENTLGFGLGRLFRQTHEICLFGVRGKIYDKLKNKSQRSVHFSVNTKHSAKPDILHDQLDLMFDNTCLKVELFARRARKGYLCAGNECPLTLKEDIRESLRKLKALPNSQAKKLLKLNSKEFIKQWQSI